MNEYLKIFARVNNTLSKLLANYHNFLEVKVQRDDVKEHFVFIIKYKRGDA